MPCDSVNQTRLWALVAVPTPLLALDVQRGGIPGQPGAAVSGPGRCWGSLPRSWPLRDQPPPPREGASARGGPARSRVASPEAGRFATSLPLPGRGRALGAALRAHGAAWGSIHASPAPSRPLAAEGPKLPTGYS